MNDDRATVLAQVRKSLTSALLPGARASIPPQPPTPSVDVASMVESFTRELADVGGQVYRPQPDAEAIEHTIDLIRATGGNEILAWDDSDLPLPGLGEAMRAAGFVSLGVRLSTDPELRRARLAELARASAGVTGALAGLADTGSLVLLSGPTRPRLASLLPPVHIAVLSIATLYPTIAAFLAAHPTVTREASNLVFVTGPSRTADIELILTRGVHGPRELHVVLIP